MTPACVAVAYSGGRDSSALLHATLAAAGALDIGVAALHVHHGLMADADAWLLHCEQQCRRWAKRGRRLVFDHRRLDGNPARGESVEAWARRERYAALREMAAAHAASAVLLAHHRLDQAETLLLQALRGAGVAGLAAMPEVAQRDGISWLRPWLDVDPAHIAAYVRRHRIAFVEDDSNTDPRYARNRLRLRVWPALIAGFPDAQEALAASAGWAQEARACADALATIDLTEIADERGLRLVPWQALPPARRSNALRAWLEAQTGKAAASSAVRRLLDELPASSAPARWPLGRFELRRYRGRLGCTAISQAALRDSAAEHRSKTLAVTSAGNYALAGWGGAICATRVTQGGVALAALAQLRLAERRGGEQFQSALERPARSLKKQYQSHAVPAWERQGPLLYNGDELIFVPGLGIDARALAAHGEAQLHLAWIAGPR